MGRRDPAAWRRSTGVVAIAAAVALTALAAGGCASGPQRVTLERLAEEQEAFDGQEVVTVGTVVHFSRDTIPHHVIEDPGQNRVMLVPDDVAFPYRGERVEVTGRFVFDPDRGRLIEVDDIRPLRG